jgi:hypothetical protein
MARFPGNDLLIAHDPNGGRLMLSARDRSTHMYVVGATGVGKSKFLEHIVRQDIETRSDSYGTGSNAGSMRVDGSSGGFEELGGVPQLASQWSTSEARSSSDSRSASQSTASSEASSESESEVPILLPVFGQELSSVQFRSIEEQQFRAEQQIMFQPDRHATVRVRGMREPVHDYYS